MDLNVTIIIPSYNDSDVLKRAVECVAKQNYPQKLIELIIVDDCSDEPVKPPVKDKYVTIIRHEKNKGRAASRNTGIKNANNKLLIFLDSDILADKELVSAHVKAHKTLSSADGKTVFLGTVRWHPDVKKNHFTMYSRWFEYDRVFDKPELSYDDFAGANFSIMRETLTESGILFDERFDKYGMEDLEFGYRLKKAGFQFKFSPHAIGLHFREATLEDQIKRGKESAGSISYFLIKSEDADVSEKLKVLPPDLYRQYSVLFSEAESIALSHIDRLAKYKKLNSFEQEILAVCFTFLIEYAPLEALYELPLISDVKYFSNKYKNTIIDWAFRVNIIDRIYAINIGPITINKEINDTIPDMMLRQALCHESGRYFITRKNYNEASKILKPGLEYNIEPNKDMYLTMYLLGSIAERQRAYNDAEKYFRRVVDEGKNYIHASQCASAYYHLGKIAMDARKDKSAAKKYFQAAIDLCHSHADAKLALEELS